MLSRPRPVSRDSTCACTKMACRRCYAWIRDLFLRLLAGIQQFALHAGEQIALDADGGEQLRLRLCAERQTPELDKAQRGVVVELVAAVIGGQGMVIERVLGFAPDHCAVPGRKLKPDGPADKALRALDIRGQVLVQGAVPLPVVDEPRVFSGHDLFETRLLAAEGEAL